MKKIPVKVQLCLVIMCMALVIGVLCYVLFAPLFKPTYTDNNNESQAVKINTMFEPIDENTSKDADEDMSHMVDLEDTSFGVQESDNTVNSEIEESNTTINYKKDAENNTSDVVEEPKIKTNYIDDDTLNLLIQKLLDEYDADDVMEYDGDDDYDSVNYANAYVIYDFVSDNDAMRSLFYYTDDYFNKVKGSCDYTMFLIPETGNITDTNIFYIKGYVRELDTIVILQYDEAYHMWGFNSDLGDYSLEYKADLLRQEQASAQHNQVENVTQENADVDETEIE